VDLFRFCSQNCLVKDARSAIPAGLAHIFFKLYLNQTPLLFTSFVKTPWRNKFLSGSSKVSFSLEHALIFS
jgi:hypothetical protein